MRKKTTELHSSLEISVFGKKCQFKVLEVTPESNNANQKYLFTAKTSITVVLDKEGEKSQEENPVQEEGDENTLDANQLVDICEDLNREQLAQLVNMISFNLDPSIGGSHKLFTLGLVGRPLSGKKTLLRRVAKHFGDKVQAKLEKFEIVKDYVSII